jgi:hypothetical protein
MSNILKQLQNQSGATVVMVGLLLVVLAGFTALAIDIGYLLMVRNQLQNAADAGALAGASVLYNEDGTIINAGANQVAFDMVTANMASSVEGEMPAESRAGDIQRGHWSFATRTFTPNDSLSPTDLWDKTTAELDADLNFINAVRVKTRRETIPAASIFAGIFGYDNFFLSTEAIAYIGFTGNLAPTEVDQPIAICRNAVTDLDGNYNCNVGKMVTDSGDETAAWTNFNQPATCTGGANAQSVQAMVCQSGNQSTINLGRDMQMINGQAQNAYSDFFDCWWVNSEGGTKPWEMTLAVIDCNPNGTVNPCARVRGAVTVNVVWVNDTVTNPAFMDGAPSNMQPRRPGGAPLSMQGFGEGAGRYGNWSADLNTPGEERWASFVDHFNLDTNTVEPIDGWTQKTIYFVPSCEPHELTGDTGGENYGMLAARPVLVNRPNDN